MSKPPPLAVAACGRVLESLIAPVASANLTHPGGMVERVRGSNSASPLPRSDACVLRREAHDFDFGAVSESCLGPSQHLIGD